MKFSKLSSNKSLNKNVYVLTSVGAAVGPESIIQLDAKRPGRILRSVWSTEISQLSPRAGKLSSVCDGQRGSIYLPTWKFFLNRAGKPPRKNVSPKLRAGDHFARERTSYTWGGASGPLLPLIYIDSGTEEPPKMSGTVKSWSSASFRTESGATEPTRIPWYNDGRDLPRRYIQFYLKDGKHPSNAINNFVAARLLAHSWIRDNCSAIGTGTPLENTRTRKRNGRHRNFKSWISTVRFKHIYACTLVGAYNVEIERVRVAKHVQALEYFWTKLNSVQ